MHALVAYLKGALIAIQTIIVKHTEKSRKHTKLSEPGPKMIVTLQQQNETVNG